MSTWGRNNQANNAPSFTIMAIGVQTPASNSAIFANTTAVGVFGITPALMPSANATGAAHAGWTVRTVGTGDRAGRVTSETLVALSSIT